jgi:hypothetical protein
LLARAPQVVRLAFGHLDFQLDMGMRCTPDEPELTYARFAFVAASRRAGLPPPVDGVTTDLGNAERLALDTQRARAFGFGAKRCRSTPWSRVQLGRENDRPASNPPSAEHSGCAVNNAVWRNETLAIKYRSFTAEYGN